MPLGSRIIRYVRDGQTDRRMDGQKQAYPLSLQRRGHDNILLIIITDNINNLNRHTSFIEFNGYSCYRFLPRDAMRKRGLCRHSVSVCVSVCHVRGSCQNE